VEFFQIIWFTFIALESWPGYDFTVFLNAFQLNFSISWYAFYWIFAAWGFVVLLVVLIFLCCCDGNEEMFMIVGMVFLSMIPIFQPMMIKMMEALVCTYPVDGPPTLDADPNTPKMECWTGVHLVYAVISLIVIVFFYPAVSIAMSVLVGGKNDRIVWLAFLLIQFKMLQVFCYAFFKTFVLAFLLCMLGVNISFALICLWLPDTYLILAFLRRLGMALVSGVSSPFTRKLRSNLH